MAATVSTGPAHASPTRPQDASASPLTVTAQTARAATQAKATGHDVVVAALTTPTSTTTATPRGTYVLTQTLAPTRVRRGGTYVPLNARLHTNPDQTLAPNATTSGLVLSGGGTGPLAIMNDAGRSLSLAWPTPLPKPVVHADTATYALAPGVELVVTVTEQGGYTQALVIKNRAAAADPRWATLTLATRANGVTLDTDAAGDLTADTGAPGAPVFTAAAPTMWDSTASPATAPGIARPGVPTDSGATGPGAHAHTARVTTSVATSGATPAAQISGRAGAGALALSIDRALFTDPTTTFPVYAAVTWQPALAPGHIQAWGSVADALPTANEFDNTYDPQAHVMQVGYSGDNYGAFHARSYFRTSVDSRLHGATIYNSTISFTEQADYACGGQSANELDLYWTGGIPDPFTWNNKPGNNQKVASDTVKWCTNTSVEFNITSFMQAKASANSALTFGMQAGADNNDGWWELWENQMSMSTEYDHAPNLPKFPATSPGGACRTTSATAPVIGNDDVTFSIIASDVDNDHLGSQFVIDDATGTKKYDTGSGAISSASGGVAQIIIKRDQFQTWSPAKATYHWYTTSTDGKLGSPGSGTGSIGNPCYFTYDPTAPSQPTIQIADDAGALGGAATITIAQCTGALASPPLACTGTAPARYSYQINDAAPATVPVTGTTQTHSIPLTHLGANAITVSGISIAGNPSPPNSTSFTVDPPQNPYGDGDINGDGKPDLLAVGPGTQPGLWAATSDGAGHLGNPTDIGADGTGIDTDTSPTYWNGALALHGDFTGDHVQDVVAYYPATGDAVELYGSGDVLPLSPTSGNAQGTTSGAFADPNGDSPIDLVAAGDASTTTPATSPPDLIGISGDATNPYTLNVYTGGAFFEYSDTEVLATTSPDGAADWNDWTLTTAQPDGDTVLFALNNRTGALWESTNPTQSPAVTSLIGAPGTWTPITTPWTSGWTTGKLRLISGDVNTAGDIELWAQAGLNLTAYTLTGPSLTLEAASTLLAPAHQWPLADGASPTADATGNVPAQLSAGVSWASSDTDPVHGTVAQFDGTSGYLTMPPSLTQNQNASALTLSLSFKADPGSSGVLFASGHAAPDAASPDGGAAPIMYLGTDGHLYGQFWNAAHNPMISPTPVNDGQWHTVTLVGTGTSQTLYLDNDIPISQASTNQLADPDPLVFAGAGTINQGTWINAPGTPGTLRASYFNGQMADIAFYTQALTQAQLAPGNVPTATTGAITSALTGSLCVDDRSNDTTNGNPIQLWTCNGTPAQQWTLTPQGTITLNVGGHCMDISGASPTNGTPIDLYPCTGGNKQQWQLRSDGSIYDPVTNRCLDDPGASTTLGTQLDVWTCVSGAKNEQWTTPTP